MPQRILILGHRGQLATELLRLAPPVGVQFIALGRDQLDLSQTNAIDQVLRSIAPTAIINTAAFTAVDRAETERAEAFALNRNAPHAIAKFCAEFGTPLIHLSTDYVFDGAKLTPYLETDVAAPLNIYGASKLAGEQAVLNSGARAAIIRTSWVFASHGTSFVRTMLRLAEMQDEVRVVADQVGRPTWAQDLARCCLEVALRACDHDPAAQGVLHFAGVDDASWADLAEATFASVGCEVEVRRAAARDYPTPARRPLNSRLDTSKIAHMGIAPRPWREALRLCLSDLSKR